MNREEFLKKLIEQKFYNVKRFSEHIGLPYTTVRTILEKGVGNARVDNVIKICKGLGIKPEALSEDFVDLNHISNSEPINLIDLSQNNTFTKKDEEFDEEIRAIARDMKNLSSDKKDLLKSLIKTMSEAGDKELDK